MKIVKILLLLVVSLVALVFGAAAVVPKEYAIEKEVVINKNNIDIFNYIKFVKNQDNYSVWAKMDPEMTRSYKGTDGTVGFISAWESNHKHVGKGEQEIKKITEGKRIDLELRFIEPFEATDIAYMTTDSLSDNSTKVMWGFKGHMAYPMNLMLLMMDMEKEVGTPLQQGLVNLKEIMEK